MKALYVIDPADNVGTALEALEIGPTRLLGALEGSIDLHEAVPVGHKAALRSIRRGENVVKYGVAIARATGDIAAGEYVHIHNCASPSDRRTGHFDGSTGAPEDMRYVRWEEVR